jgi:hypothetical protein
VDQLLDLLQSLVLQHLLQQPLHLAGAEGSRQAQDLQGAPFLDELALDAQSLLRHLLPAVVADLLIPRLLAPLLEVTLYFQAPHRLYFPLVPHQYQSPHVFQGDLLLHK